jgi:methyltransferase (TIGR00027 family)
MRGRASFTAAWVAGWRGLGSMLGDAQIADDPWGVRFGGRWARALARVSANPVARRLLIGNAVVGHWLGYMQVRTRAIDDALHGFVARGGRQVVILGAGYDCRAARFARELDGVHVLEVDHPATQARKREVLAGTGAATYVAWDFEARPLDELPGALAALGLDPARPTLTIWEGVTMYLSVEAIEASFAAIRRLGAPGSTLVFTYVERARLERPRPAARLVAAFVARVGEPFRWGWDPAALPAWLDARGYALVTDQKDAELAAALLPPEIAGTVAPEGRHVAVAAAS